jgi:pSer/pThr/pTyr-binding forkhead associated (FHA) protein
MSAMTCPNCSTPAPAGAIFCDNCGYDLRNVAPAATVLTPAPAWQAQPAGGVVCPNCHSPNIAGALFCENCGSQLSQPQAPVTPPAPLPPAAAPPYQPPAAPPYQPPAAPAAYPPPVPSPQPAYQPPVPPAPVVAAPLQIAGRLVIQGANVSLPIPPGKQEVLIGREDPVSGVFPDINLDPYGGQEAGVSRRHARIILHGGTTMLEDLNTVNGTVHNRQRLAPGQAVALNDGDELRLGKMALIYQAN